MPPDPSHPSPIRQGVRPVDPDVDLHVPGQRREWREHRWVLPAISLGGVLGASARYGLGLAHPTAPGSLPVATLATNVTGCLLIGLLMVCLVESDNAHPLWRPFLGVGLLGGFTTLSTYTVETHTLLAEGYPGLALGYLFGTLVLGLAAVSTGAWLGRGLRRPRRRVARRSGP